jgi:hypothetical protein
MAELPCMGPAGKFEDSLNLSKKLFTRFLDIPKLFTGLKTDFRVKSISFFSGGCLLTSLTTTNPVKIIQKNCSKP